MCLHGGVAAMSLAEVLVHSKLDCLDLVIVG
jgi:hypothetical protein